MLYIVYIFLLSIKDELDLVVWTLLVLNSGDRKFGIKVFIYKKY